MPNENETGDLPLPEEPKSCTFFMGPDGVMREVELVSNPLGTMLSEYAEQKFKTVKVVGSPVPNDPYMDVMFTLPGDQKLITYDPKSELDDKPST